ncbi:LysR substrate-binding domain-containing protein [Marinobacterium arenosum]|uniref:LysR substrate-binding domain-containing protein n=1 Tax=Marinobacterium arenosum TaxID=2862496 RepID=UPI001C9788C4|nr:LysR substrate-binding domain-containing protein [Marinobacterium arenosum]MBY4677206.1 LysR family transcriptional regulator [Marinobacterium arenosum]
MRLARRLPPLDTLISFEAVARHGSFTAAANELCLTQSAVSKQVRALEENLQLTLFHRHARGIELNDAGQQLLADVQPLLYSLARTVERLKQAHDANTVTIAATHAVSHHWLFPRLTAFSRAHPEIHVSIHSSNEITEAGIGDYDFGILYGEGQWPSLEAAPLFAERIYPVCRIDYPVSEPDSLESLQDCQLIQLDSRAWNCLDWREWFGHFGIDYQPPADAITFNQVTLVYNAALEGLGIALGWDFMAADAIERGQLKPVGNFVYETGKHDYLVNLRHKRLSKSAQLFRDWMLNTEAH